MRAERHEPHRLLSPVPAQDLAHRARQVVVAQQAEHPAEIAEGFLMRLQEGLLRRVQVGPVERRATRHRAHCEYLHPGPLAAEVSPGLVPVHLRLLAQAVALRYEGLAQHQAHRALALPHVVAHRRLSHRGTRELLQQPPMQAPRRMPLLARRTPILLQHSIDERRDRVQFWLGPLRVVPRRWQGTGQRLPHQSTVHPELGRHACHRPDPELMLPAKLLEQIHLGVPIHSKPPGSPGETVG
jgi:hypothetical protein